MRKGLLVTALLLLASLWWSCAFASDSKPATAANQTVIEGVLTQVSKLPAAEKNPYPDCYYTAVLDIKNIISGQRIPKRIILVLPGFFSRRYAPEAGLKVGDMVRATVVPFSSMPDKVRQTQQADEIEDVDLEFFFPQKISTVKEFGSSVQGVSFAEKQEVQGGTFKKVDSNAAIQRRGQIKKDLEEIDKLLKEHGGDWDRWYNSLEKSRKQYNQQFERNATKWIGDSFFGVGELPFGKFYSPEFVKSVIAFKDYLSARNVDLIVLRVPYKGEISDDIFSDLPQGEVTNPYLLRMYKELLEADVEVVTDIIPRAKNSRFKYPLMYWYSDRPERHPAEGMAWVAAEALADRVKRYERIATYPPAKLHSKSVSTGMDLDSFLWATEKCNPFWPKGNPKFNPAEYITFTGIFKDDGKPLGRKLGVDSPILVVGSSFTEYPSLKFGGNITSYLAYLTGVIPDMLYRAGSDASIPRMLAREGDKFLEARAVCIFPMVPMVTSNALDLPPVVDTAKSARTLLASYSGKALAEATQFEVSPQHATHSFTEQGTLLLKAREPKGREETQFDLRLPKSMAGYSFVVVEIESKPGDAAIIKGKYAGQVDAVHKSYSQAEKVDSLAFKVTSEEFMRFNISNIRSDITTQIDKISIYGIGR